MPGSFHAVFGHPLYGMGVPHYAYLQLKMTGPKEIITAQGDLQHACQGSQESIERDKALVAEAEFGVIKQEVFREAAQEVSPTKKGQSSSSFQATQHPSQP